MDNQCNQNTDINQSTPLFSRCPPPPNIKTLSRSSSIKISHKTSTFSVDSMENNSPLRLCDVQNNDQLQFDENVLFCSNPELGPLNDNILSRHHKREKVNQRLYKAISSSDDLFPISSTTGNTLLRKCISSNPTCSSRNYENKKKAIRHFRSCQKLSTTSEISASINELMTLTNDDVIYEWHNKSTINLNVTLQDFSLCRPKKFLKGGQGSLYLVSDGKTDQKYVLKYKKRLNKTENCWQIEHREYLILKELNHVLIVNLNHVFCTQSTIFIIMEHLNGGCLLDIVWKRGLLTESLCSYYAACVLTALEYLHERFIIFRDLKSANIVLDWYRRPKLIDFGMAKYIRGHETEEIKSRITKTSGYQPSIYLAPEIYLAAKYVGVSVDMWGVGYIIMELQLGCGVHSRLPWYYLHDKQLTKDWVLKLSPNLVNKSKNVENLLHQLLKQDPSSRPDIKTVKTHAYFENIDWNNLCFTMGPNIENCQFLSPKSGEVTENNCVAF